MDYIFFSNQFQQFNENNYRKKERVLTALCPGDVGKCRPKQKSQTCYNFHEEVGDSKTLYGAGWG